MPDAGPFGETFFEASVRAIVAASFLNNPSGGWVASEIAVTSADQRRVVSALRDFLAAVLWVFDFVGMSSWMAGGIPGLTHKYEFTTETLRGGEFRSHIFAAKVGSNFNSFNDVVVELAQWLRLASSIPDARVRRLVEQGSSVDTPFALGTAKNIRQPDFGSFIFLSRAICSALDLVSTE
jgi:hypothetical protein